MFIVRRGYDLFGRKMDGQLFSSDSSGIVGLLDNIVPIASNILFDTQGGIDMNGCIHDYESFGDFGEGIRIHRHCFDGIGESIMDVNFDISITILFWSHALNGSYVGIGVDSVGIYNLLHFDSSENVMISSSVPLSSSITGEFLIGASFYDSFSDSIYFTTLSSMKQSIIHEVKRVTGEIMSYQIPDEYELIQPFILKNTMCAIMVVDSDFKVDCENGNMMQSVAGIDANQWNIVIGGSANSPSGFENIPKEVYRSSFSQQLVSRMNGGEYNLWSVVANSGPTYDIYSSIYQLSLSPMEIFYSGK